MPLKVAGGNSMFKRNRKNNSINEICSKFETFSWNLMFPCKTSFALLCLDNITLALKAIFKVPLILIFVAATSQKQFLF